MTTRKQTANIFEGHGYSFQEIAIGGRLGGHEALVRYLKLRCSHFHRLARQGGATPEVLQQANLMHKALQEALSILNSIAPNVNLPKTGTQASQTASAGAR